MSRTITSQYVFNYNDNLCLVKYQFAVFTTTYNSIMFNTITLSDGLPFRVPQLGIFELDELREAPMGVFTYEVEVMGKRYDVEFDISTWDHVPVKPDNPNPKPETPEWYALQEYTLYQAGVLHEERRQQQMYQYVEKVGRYILRKCPDDINRIITYNDWEKIYNTALVPQLTVEILATTLQKTYQASFEGIDVFEALSELGNDTGGSYNTLRQWENEVMLRMRMTELEYALLPLDERARKVCAIFLPEIMAALSADKYRRESEAKRRNAKKG